MKKAEISLPEILRIFTKRKWFIILTIIGFIIAAFIYNEVKTPVYEASVLLKKELNLADQSQGDRLANIMAIRSQDELETEMQLVQTRDVINNVISELSLNIMIDQIVEQDGTVTMINLPVPEYQYRLASGNYFHNLPKINKINTSIKTKAQKFIFKYASSGESELLDNTKKNIQNNTDRMPSDDLEGWEFDIEWGSGKSGEIHFSSLDYNKLFKEISENIYTDKKIKTSIFEVGVRSNYPHTTKLIANSLAEKFKESRISLQKDNIKYTFNFIDERLNEVAQKLKSSENELSSFKEKTQLIQINDQSRQLIDYLSSLESAKLNNDLELELYKNKLKGIKSQLSSDGFVDQTYLTPEQYQNTDAPFSNLLTQLSNLEIQKLELLQRRTELHPDVVLLNDQIERIEAELRKYNKNTLNAYEILSASLSSRQKHMDSLILKYSNKIKELPQQEAKLADLLRKKDAYEKMYTLLLDKREEMRVAELSRMQDIIVLDPAVEPTVPVLPNKKLNLLFAGLLGLALGFFAVLFVQSTDTKVNDIRDIENEFNYPILSVIPPFTKKISETISTSEAVKNRFVTMMDEQFRYKEAYRTLETKLFSKIKSSPKAVMITSCEEDSGKTTTAMNLAITAAQSGKKVLLIDCDIKNPSIGNLLGLPKFSSGLMDYLTEQTDTPNIYKPVKLSSNSNLLINLDVLPTGQFTNISGEILSSDRMKQLLSKMEYYDFVIIDTAPITRLADAISLGRIVKDTILVIREGQTVKESISWAIAELETSEINFQGLVINDSEVKRGSFKYHYGYMNNN